LPERKKEEEHNGHIHNYPVRSIRKKVLYALRVRRKKGERIKVSLTKIDVREKEEGEGGSFIFFVIGKENKQHLLLLPLTS